MRPITSMYAPPGVALAERRVDQIVVKLRGEHDVSTAVALAATMNGAVALGDTDMVVDLSRAVFMDASTIGVVLRTREQLRRCSRTLTVRDPSVCARRLLWVCGLDELIEIAPGGLDLEDRVPHPCRVLAFVPVPGTPTPTPL